MDSPTSAGSASGRRWYVHVAVSGSMDDRVIEFVEHLHEHFLDPVVIRDGQLGEWFCVYAANGAGTCVPAH